MCMNKLYFIGFEVKIRMFLVNNWISLMINFPASVVKLLQWDETQRAQQCRGPFSPAVPTMEWNVSHTSINTPCGLYQ